VNNHSDVYWLIAKLEAANGDEETFTTNLYRARARGRDFLTDQLLERIARVEDTQEYAGLVALIAISEGEEQLLDIRERIGSWLKLYAKIRYHALGLTITGNSIVDQVIVSFAAAAEVERTIYFHPIGPLRRDTLCGSAFVFRHSDVLFSFAESVTWGILGDIHEGSGPLRRRVDSMVTERPRWRHALFGIALGVLVDGQPVCCAITDDTLTDGYWIDKMKGAEDRLTFRLTAGEDGAFHIGVAALGQHADEEPENYIVAGHYRPFDEDSTESLQSFLEALDESDELELQFCNMTAYNDGEEPFYSVTIPKQRVDIQSIERSEWLFDDLRRIEQQLRRVILATLRGAHGEAWYSEGVPTGAQQEIAERIEKQIKRQPYRDKQATWEDVLEFADIGHLKDIILFSNNWRFFSNRFGRKANVDGHFTDFIALRNTLVHHRELDPVVGYKGLGAMMWIDRCLGVGGTEEDDIS
jgi:hypothetical protein